MRQRDLHILTSALHTYTNDWRISALHTTVRETRGSRSSFNNGTFTRQAVESREAQSPRTKNNVTDVWDDDDGGVWSEWTLVSYKQTHFKNPNTTSNDESISRVLYGAIPFSFDFSVKSISKNLFL